MKPESLSEDSFEDEKVLNTKVETFGPESVIYRSYITPSINVRSILYGPFKLERTQGVNFVKKFILFLSKEEFTNIDDSRKSENCLRVMLRSYKTQIGNDLKLEERHHMWPMETAVALYRQGSNSKLKGDCDPLDLFPYMKIGENNLEVSSYDAEAFYMVIQLIESVSVRQLVDRIKNKKRISLNEAIIRVQNSFKSSNNSCSADDELMTTSTRISLRCPLGLTPIKDPGRGINCTHLQCFDIATFFSFNEKNSGAVWRCSVCNIPLDPNEIVVDEYFSNALNELGDQASTVDEIEIYSDGHWEAVTESAFVRRNNQRIMRKARKLNKDSTDASNTIENDTYGYFGQAVSASHIPIDLISEECRAQNCDNGRIAETNVEIIDISLDTDSENEENKRRKIDPPSEKKNAETWSEKVTYKPPFWMTALSETVCSSSLEKLQQTQSKRQGTDEFEFWGGGGHLENNISSINSATLLNKQHNAWMTPYTASQPIQAQSTEAVLLRPERQQHRLPPIEGLLALNGSFPTETVADSESCDNPDNHMLNILDLFDTGDSTVS